MHARVCLKKVCSLWYTIIIPPAPSVVFVVPVSQRSLSNPFDDAKVANNFGADKDRNLVIPLTVPQLVICFICCSILPFLPS